MKKILGLAGLLILATAPYAEELNYNVIGLSAKAEREVPVSYTHLTLPTTPYV